MNISVTASVLFALSLLFSGCQRQEKTPKAIAVENNDLNFLNVSCSIGRELPRSKSFVLTISNLSTQNLDEVSIEVNDTYSSSLEEFLIYRGFKKGNQPLGRNQILANEEVIILSSHDIPNHYVMKNASGEPMPDSMVPVKITIRTNQGKGTWNFQE